MGNVPKRSESNGTSRAAAAGRIPVQVKRTQNGLSIGGSAMARRTSLGLPDELTPTAWTQIGQQVCRISDSSAWWIADWIVYGQNKFPDLYRQAIRETGLSYQTLRNYAWVARRFTVSRRDDRLSFQHHAQVAALPEDEQDQWLSNALAKGWSAAELRKQLQWAREKDRATADGVTTLRLDPSAEEVERWNAAAKAEEQTLRNWAIGLLDEAASRILKR